MKNIRPVSLDGAVMENCVTVMYYYKPIYVYNENVEIKKIRQVTRKT